MSDGYSLSLPVSRDPVFDHRSPVLVFPHDPHELRQHVELLARYFKREGHFDHMQFEADEAVADPDFVRYEAWLFHVPAWDLATEDQGTPRRMIGACCFRWREWSDLEPGWSLDWIWLHPFERDRGHLSKAWPVFEARYGASFHVATPLSLAMQAFLIRRGHPAARPEKIEVEDDARS
ncbi:hypothetical protein [Burkholderia territorii]|uniref:hypothetical protein n=1 Tax=Burkholderia territorii TaxID=1503055 RepID=UPI000A762DDD|nr:hypothetical protein [Burkholderia territorii]